MRINIPTSSTIDEEGKRLPDGAVGELVGRSPTMMSGYQNQPEKTQEASWFDEEGGRWQRMGDIGRVDADGFVELVGRAKDMIISGGFNIYPVDLEAVLMQHPDVEEAAVIGMPSDKWGETPVGFVSPARGATLNVDAVLTTTNARLGSRRRNKMDSRPCRHDERWIGLSRPCDPTPPPWP
jgi:acyl-CoA synthetase (AMP-forming)/AMP-acid ligase II